MNLTIGTGKKQTLKEQYGPLMKIVREFSTTEKDVTGFQHTRLWEELACGHIIPVKKDIYGYTNAARRRCYRCRDNK